MTSPVTPTWSPRSTSSFQRSSSSLAAAVEGEHDLKVGGGVPQRGEDDLAADPVEHDPAGDAGGLAGERVRLEVGEAWPAASWRRWSAGSRTRTGRCPRPACAPASAGAPAPARSRAAASARRRRHAGSIAAPGTGIMGSWRARLPTPVTSRRSVASRARRLSTAAATHPKCSSGLGDRHGCWTSRRHRILTAVVAQGHDVGGRAGPCDARADWKTVDDASARRRGIPLPTDTSTRSWSTGGPLVRATTACRMGRALAVTTVARLVGWTSNDGVGLGGAHAFDP